MFNLPKNYYKVIYADPPWHFRTFSEKGQDRAPSSHYSTMSISEICAMPVAELAADDCILFMWTCWPFLFDSQKVIQSWGFKYKTCAFSWMKADPYRLFADEKTPFAGMGYWTRANTEPCLLATRGKPKRKAKDVRQAVLEPRREHSRKPDCIYERIERLVDGPYLEIFARNSRSGWDAWGNEVGKFDTINKD